MIEAGQVPASFLFLTFVHTSDGVRQKVKKFSDEKNANVSGVVDL